MTTSPAAISLRPIRMPDDLEFLIQVYAGTRAAEMALVNWTDAQKDAFVRAQFHAQHTFYQEQFQTAQFDVILHDDQAIGRLYIDRQPDSILIIDIALLPDYQQHGFGTHLLQQLIAESRQSGRPLRIHVEQFNPALRWYQQAGFQMIELQGVYYQMERQPDYAGT